ncbi:lipase member I-like [Episyrphus balteatus]|uniref:lipase member I-like n=1 Tax=Episyrphus balteatus TaxID=286459 RepID=UPI00248517A5|nr:lipase member I-like [Episyrphus balteatus]
MFSKILKYCLLLNFNLLLVSQEVAARVEAYETTLIFYYGPKFTDFQRYKLSNAAEILYNPHFKYGETHLYLHGWHESQTMPDIQTIVDAYLKRNDINLIVVDWGKAAAERYVEASFKNIELLAPVLADSILDLYRAGIHRKDLRVVAHSLGAQLAGMTSRHIMWKSNGNIKIHRLELLDAAFPLFFLGILPKVNKNDADFVQAIHTGSGTYGQPKPIGHVDFWPNYGRKQPGCSNRLIVIPFTMEDLCSHQRSWRFWAESVANVYGTNPRFLALPFSNAYNTIPTEMGINCPISARGNKWLRTNNEPLFARGKYGLL